MVSLQSATPTSDENCVENNSQACEDNDVVVLGACIVDFMRLVWLLFFFLLLLLMSRFFSYMCIGRIVIIGLEHVLVYSHFVILYCCCSLSLSVSVSISYVPHLPSAGETLSATKFQNDFGGKAANQCVTAAKLGSKAALISKVCKINCFA